MAAKASTSKGVAPMDVGAYEPALRRYFRSRAHAAEVDDLVQEVFASLYARQSEAPIEDPQRYLFTVAAHTLARSRRRPAPLPIPEGEDSLTREEISPERLLLGRESLGRAIAVIEGLPERTRQVFVLHRFGEMSYGRIAAEMGVSVSAVEKHISAALRALLATGQEG